MPLRVAAAQISHETNVFSSVPTDLQAFRRSGLLTGAAILREESGTNSAFGGFVSGAEEFGLELVPIVSVWATPSGIVTRDAIEALGQMLVDGIVNAAETALLDGILLALHGAMVTEIDRDGDGYLLELARDAAGDLPIVATLDLHANISERMVSAADLLIGYDTYPHVDMAERAHEACGALARIVRGELSPVWALLKPPMLPTSQNMITNRNPMRRLIERAHEMERDPRVINVTIAGGFPPADVAEAGLSVIVSTDGDSTLAFQLAEELATQAWQHRDEFLGGVTSHADAARTLHALPDRPAAPVVLVDIGDNPWTGGPGDSADLLRFLLEERIDGAALALIADPESVSQAIAAGVGSFVDLLLGGKTDALHGDPLACHGVVQFASDGRYVNIGPMMAGLPVDLGPSVVIAIGDPAVLVLVTSRAETPIDLNVFRRHAIEPTELRVIALKGKGHFRAAFEPIASEVILVEGPGITGADLSRLPFSHITRPIWPLDEGVSIDD